MSVVAEEKVNWLKGKLYTLLSAIILSKVLSKYQNAKENNYKSDEMSDMIDMSETSNIT